jgi:hypothetical protein
MDRGPNKCVRRKLDGLLVRHWITRLTTALCCSKIDPPRRAASSQYLLHSGIDGTRAGSASLPPIICHRVIPGAHFILEFSPQRDPWQGFYFWELPSPRALQDPAEASRAVQCDAMPCNQPPKHSVCAVSNYVESIKPHALSSGSAGLLIGWIDGRGVRHSTSTPGLL